MEFSNYSATSKEHESDAANTTCEYSSWQSYLVSALRRFSESMQSLCSANLFLQFWIPSYFLVLGYSPLRWIFPRVCPV